MVEGVTGVTAGGWLASLPFVVMVLQVVVVSRVLKGW